MANNRLFLVHESSGNAVMLGKRMGYGWYGGPDAETLRKFYDSLLIEGDQDNFSLYMESTMDVPLNGKSHKMVQEYTSMGQFNYEWKEE